MNKIKKHISDYQDYSNIDNYLKSIEIGFKNNKVDYKKLEENSEYSAALILYLKNNGYGYLAEKVENILANKPENYIEKIFIMFCDSLLITELEISQTNPFSNKPMIKYKQNEGLIEEYTITYHTDIPFRILEVDYENKDIITHEIDNDYRVKIKINIPRGLSKIYNYTENLLIYTTNGIKKEEFTINCIESSVYDSVFGLNNVKDFYNLFKENREAAKEIFVNEEFKTWLFKNNYITEYLNYNDAIRWGKEEGINLFCQLGGVHVDIGEPKKTEVEVVVIEDVIQEEDIQPEKLRFFKKIKEFFKKIKRFILKKK